MHVEAESHALVQLDLRLRRRVDVQVRLGGHGLGLVVKRGVDDAVLDALGDDELRVGHRFQPQLRAHVLQQRFALSPFIFDLSPFILCLVYLFAFSPFTIFVYSLHCDLLLY